MTLSWTGERPTTSRNPTTKEDLDMSTGTTITDTAAGLREWARGGYNSQAAVELLIRGFNGRFARAGQPWIEQETDFDSTRRYWLDADQIIPNIGVLSGGEQRFLRIVASFEGDEPVNLSDVAGLDREHLALVLAAVAHAGGSHEMNDITIDHERMVAMRGPRLPSLYPWPEAAS